MQNRDKSFVKYLLSLSMLLPAATATAAFSEPSASATVEPTSAAADSTKAGAAPLAPNVTDKLKDLMSDGDRLAWRDFILWDQAPPFNTTDEDTTPRPSAQDVLRDLKAEKA